MDEQLIAAKKMVLKLEVLNELSSIQPGVTHGLLSRYNKGCRGPLCREARRIRNGSHGTREHPEIVQYLAELTADHQSERSEVWQHQVRGA